jgi:glucoamylase
MHLLKSTSADEFLNSYPFLYAASLPANSTIKADLEYISNHWSDYNYDPWEESYAEGHFFNIIMTREALRVGAKLARQLNDHGAADWYELQVSGMNEFAGRFWHEEDGYIKSCIRHERGVEWKIKHLDSAVLIAVLFGNSSIEDDPYSIGPYPCLATTDNSF